MVRKRMRNAENFNRPWVDYRDGFGDLYNDFWMGLDKVQSRCCLCLFLFVCVSVSFCLSLAVSQ